MSASLKQSILEEARRLGFVLAGVTTPDAPPHLSAFEAWLREGRHAAMEYMATERSRARRADPRLVLPECKSILVLAVPYSAPRPPRPASQAHELRGSIAAYAYGDDYHEVLPPRLEALVHFIEAAAARPVANRWYTDSGPLLERDLAMRAGLGWIGKNTCLIHPRRGSYFLLAEILLDLELEPDAPFTTDHCGACTRCIDACPTDCILPDRTLDAGRCISYLTIELKEDVPPDLRSKMGSWIFGCDVCQSVCPWNRFADQQGDPAFLGDEDTQHPRLVREVKLSPREFNRKFKKSPIRRARRRGYLRNVAIALGNIGSPVHLPVLEQAGRDAEPLVQRHAAWAADQILRRRGATATVPIRSIRSGIIRPKASMKLLIATNNPGKIEEMQALLAGLNLELLTPEQLGVDLRVTEDGSTYAENAEKKAVAFARITDMLSLADDSGLEVETLGGAPGIYSARYTGKAGAGDAERRALLLKNLEGKPRPWLARFRAAIAIAVPHGSVQVIEGQCPGEIIPEERGTGGFGYDPIFYIPDLGRTMAELDMLEKNRVSHRARAVLKARPILEMLAK